MYVSCYFTYVALCYVAYIMLGYICNIREVEKTELVTCTCTCRRVLRKKKTLVSKTSNCWPLRVVFALLFQISVSP